MVYAICDGASHCGDAEFTLIYHIQRIQQKHNFLYHYRASSGTQKHFQVAIAWIHQQSGWHKSILKETQTLLLHVESWLIPSLCNYLGSSGFHIEMNYIGVYPYQRVNGYHIMAKAIQSTLFSPIELKKLNYCQVYLGVTILSDITLADGRTLNPHMRLDNLSLFSSTTKQLKAKQAMPN
eukprot:1319197-Ditylum_brightwellii.AAC.1